MDYKITLTDSANTTMNVRLKLPFFIPYISPDTSTWHGDGGMLRVANGPCTMENRKLGNTDIWLTSGRGLNGKYGGLVVFWAFFDSVGLHNASGTGWIWPGSGEKLVPGFVNWLDSE